MGKVSRLLLMVVLASLLLVTTALPASAALSVDPMACWNNCGIGGPDTKTY